MGVLAEIFATKLGGIDSKSYLRDTE